MSKSARLLLFALVLLVSAPLLADSPIYYFKGDPADQANKVADNVGTATFDQTPPTGTVPVTQTGTAFANEDFVGNPLAIYWSGVYSGPAVGTLDLHWYWSSQSGAAV